VKRVTITVELISTVINVSWQTKLWFTKRTTYSTKSSKQFTILLSQSLWSRQLFVRPQFLVAVT